MDGGSGWRVVARHGSGDVDRDRLGKARLQEGNTRFVAVG